MTKTIELSKVRQGERFTLDGVEFAKLDENHMGAFIVAADALPDNCQFESDDEGCKDITTYTDTELMDELYRRRRANYDAG